MDGIDTQGFCSLTQVPIFERKNFSIEVNKKYLAINTPHHSKSFYTNIHLILNQATADGKNSIGSPVLSGCLRSSKR